jgi:ABC-2 type transport system permease protein
MSHNFGVLTLPLYLGVLFGGGFSIDYILFALVIFLINFILSLALGSLLVILGVKFVTKFGRLKFWLVFVGLIGVIALIVKLCGYSGINLGFVLSDNEDIQIFGPIAESIANLDVFKATYINIFQCVNSLALVTDSLVNGIIYGAIGLVITIIVLILNFIFVNKWYYKLLRTEKKTKNKTKNKYDKKEDLESTQFKTILKKEVKMLFRSSTAVSNIILPSILLPLIIGFSIIISITSADDGFVISDLLKTVPLGGLLVVCLGAFSFFLLTPPSSGTAISREGKAIYYLKSLPLDGHLVAKAKILVSVILSILPLVVTTVGLILVGVHDILFIVTFVYGALTICIFSSYLGLLVDARYPKIDWENEIEVVKKNFSSLIYMLVDLALSIILVSIGIVVFALSLFVNNRFIEGGVVMLSTIGLIFIFSKIKKLGSKIYKRI